MSDAERGPGEYDDLATYVREQAKAEAVIVIVLDGNRGSGFSVQAHGRSAGIVERDLAKYLRELADQIDDVRRRLS